MTTRRFHPLAERILDGERVCPAEVLEYNAATLIRRAGNLKPHDPGACKNKNCLDHGDPSKNDVGFAATLANEAQGACTCDGSHDASERRP